MTINDRIAQLIEKESGGNKRAFAKTVGVAATVVENIVGSRKTKPSFDVLEKIISAFENISIDWLVMGKGSVGNSILDVKNGYPNGYPNGYLSREVPTFKAREVPRGGIPLIPIAAAAGILSGTGVQIMDYECEYFDIPGFKNADFMIQVTGDSMVPKYESGDVVACQRLLTSTFIQWNNVYVVDSEQGILIKRLNPGSDKEHIKLVSENEKYGPFELHRTDINGLGKVVGLVRFE